MSTRHPRFLGPVIQGFLAGALGIDGHAMADMWGLAKDHVWELPQAPLLGEDYALFKEFGWPVGLSMLSL